MMGKDVDELNEKEKTFIFPVKHKNIQLTINLILCWPFELDLQL